MSRYNNAGKGHGATHDPEYFLDRGERAWRSSSASTVAKKPISETLGTVLEDVIEERQRQDARWGEQNHDPFAYLTILMEEIGEASQAAWDDRFGGPKAGTFRTEMVQVAAVAVAIIECLDRGKWRWPEVPHV